MAVCTLASPPQFQNQLGFPKRNVLSSVKHHSCVMGSPYPLQSLDVHSPHTVFASPQTATSQLNP